MGDEQEEEDDLCDGNDEQLHAGPFEVVLQLSDRFSKLNDAHHAEDTQPAENL